MKKLIVALSLLISINTAQAKLLNFRADVGSLILSGTDIGVMLNILTKFAVGGSYTKYEAGIASTTGMSVNAMFFFDDFSSDGWFLEGIYSTIDATATSISLFSATTTSVTTTGSGVSGILGYQWMWDNFNQQIGVGYRTFTVESTSTSFGDLTGGGTRFLWNIGLAF